MDRSAWLKEKRRRAEEQEDLLASRYDENWGAIAPTHRRLFMRFLELCPPGGRILDAACGTGKYWQLILDSGRTVLGIDQSAGMLARAREKFPDVPSEQLGLQEMNFQEAFAGAVCMDALEGFPPEDWPLVLGNLQRAIARNRHLYFTVEITGERELEQAFAEGRRLGLPVVYGEAEWTLEDDYRWTGLGFYHYYPAIEQVKDWVRQAGFDPIEDLTGDEYHHFLVRKP
jgi:SAM-dependent methyltransferase